MAEVIDVSLGYKHPCCACVWEGSDVCLVCKHDDYPLSMDLDCFMEIPSLKKRAQIINLEDYKNEYHNRQIDHRAQGCAKEQGPDGPVDP